MKRRSSRVNGSKDTPFFACFLHTFHSWKSSCHTSKQLERKKQNEGTLSLDRIRDTQHEHSLICLTSSLFISFQNKRMSLITVTANLTRLSDGFPTVWELTQTVATCCNCGYLTWSTYHPVKLSASSTF